MLVWFLNLIPARLKDRKIYVLLMKMVPINNTLRPLNLDTSIINDLKIGIIIFYLKYTTLSIIPVYRASSLIGHKIYWLSKRYYILTNKITLIRWLIIWSCHYCFQIIKFLNDACWGVWLFLASLLICSEVCRPLSWKNG